MKTIKKYLTKEQFSLLFEYNDGKLFWRVNKSFNSRIGSLAGRPDAKGYWRICINGKEFRRSRIVYIMHFGWIPDGLLIDHIDENKENDRIENLRICNNSENKNNTKRRADNKSGVKGVSWKVANKKWQASILVNGKNLYLGVYDKLEDAALVYKNASIKYHKEFSKI